LILRKLWQKELLIIVLEEFHYFSEVYKSVIHSLKNAMFAY